MKLKRSEILKMTKAISYFEIELTNYKGDSVFALFNMPRDEFHLKAQMDCAYSQ